MDFNKKRRSRVSCVPWVWLKRWLIFCVCSIGKLVIGEDNDNVSHLHLCWWNCFLHEPRLILIFRLPSWIVYQWSSWSSHHHIDSGAVWCATWWSGTTTKDWLVRVVAKWPWSDCLQWPMSQGIAAWSLLRGAM
jgi:hypothetical protein